MLMSLAVVISSPGEGQAAAQSCPEFGNATTIGALTRTSINEASGLVASRDHSNRFWLHNDSGGSARIFAMTQTGEDRGTVNLGNRPASDFEDIAIGPGPGSKEYLYIADIGNNSHGRATVRIYRIVEPTPPGAGKTITIPDSQIETFVYAYENPNNPGTHWRRNAESLIIDPVSGDLIVFEKQVQTINGRSNMGWVYKIDKDELVEGSTITAKPKTAVKQRIDTKYSPLTGADISVDGKLIIAKNGAETFAWLRSSGQTVFAALAAHPVSSCIAPKTPGEAIAILPNGSAFITVTERVHAPVWRIDVDYDGSPPPPPPPPPPSGGYNCFGREATIIGTNGDDVLIGTDGVDVIMGLDGDDVIKGLARGDYICGGDGKDRIFGNAGHDTINGNQRSDVIKGGRGDDFILGDRGFDRLNGQEGADYIAGALGNDRLNGGKGPDELLAGAGIDKCFGGAGDDEYESCE